jgi:hypothetical protein
MSSAGLHDPSSELAGASGWEESGAHVIDTLHYLMLIETMRQTRVLRFLKFSQRLRGTMQAHLKRLRGCKRLLRKKLYRHRA